MSRVLVNEAKIPNEITLGGESKWVCMCGLSKNQPFCDGNHARTQDEQAGRLYQYDSNGKQKEVVVKDA